MSEKTYKERVLEGLKSCDSYLSAQETATLLVEKDEAPWDVNRVQAYISFLKKDGYRIETKKKGKVVFYKLQSLPVPEPVRDKPYNGVSAPLKSKPTTMSERCAYLVQAGRSLSAYQVADFFEISVQEAQTLLLQVANGNPGKYKLTIRIEVV